MKRKSVFTANEFAEFARTTRDTLRYYDKIGLLHPVFRNEQNFRQYSHTQLATINLIRTCQALGMTLSEIQQVLEQRSPVEMSRLLKTKIGWINETMEDWQQSRKLLCVLIDTINSVLDVDETAITVEYRAKQAITLGEKNDYSNDRDDYDALASFYKSCKQRYPDMDMNYSVWGMYSEERIKRRDWHWPCHYYFNDPDGLDARPAGFYVIGYKRGGYGQSTDLYVRLLDYIAANNLEICGPTYEEYPLNEICVSDDSNYLIRVMINVTK